MYVCAHMCGFAQELMNTYGQDLDMRETETEREREMVEAEREREREMREAETEREREMLEAEREREREMREAETDRQRERDCQDLKNGDSAESERLSALLTVRSDSSPSRQRASVGARRTDRQDKNRAHTLALSQLREPENGDDRGSEPPPPGQGNSVVAMGCKYLVGDVALPDAGLLPLTRMHAHARTRTHVHARTHLRAHARTHASNNVVEKTVVLSSDHVASTRLRYVASTRLRYVASTRLRVVYASSRLPPCHALCIHARP